MDAARIAYMLEGALAVAAETVTHGGPSATREHIEQRLAVCQSCEEIVGENCRLCGCKCNGRAAWKNKLAWRNSSCPAGKWPAID